jgi:hypothetical protein
MNVTTPTCIKQRQMSEHTSSHPFREFGLDAKKVEKDCKTTFLGSHKLILKQVLAEYEFSEILVCRQQDGV